MSKKASILLNRRVDGEFAFSKDFKAYAKQHKAELRKDFDEIDNYTISSTFEDYDEVHVRSAPSLLRLIRAFGVEKCGKQGACNLKIVDIDAMLLDFVSIADADAVEHLVFDHAKYWTHLNTSTLSNKAKVARMNRFAAEAAAAEAAVKALSYDVREFPSLQESE